MPFKITVIGAGSVGFTREIVYDLLSIPAFSDIQLAFTDINEKSLDMAVRLIQRDIDSNGLKIKIQATTDRRQALKDAKYVLNFVRIGMLDSFSADVNIPMKYGVDQCVGDTLCAGGIMYGQRGIPAVLEFCKDIREVANPGCIMLNYANPNAMLTWACNKYGGVHTIGLCHGVLHGHELIGKALGIDWKEIDITCVGINHQTWYTRIEHNGESLLDKLLPAMQADKEIAEKEKVRIDMLLRFGYFSTESNGHLSEYLPWYRKDVSKIADWISMDKWINGESGGYLRHCIERRNWYETDFPAWLEQAPWKYKVHDAVEHAAHIIEGLELGTVYRGHFNVPNNGCITNLPNDAIVEVPCYVTKLGIDVPVYGDLPLGCAAICMQSINVQRLAVEAAVHGDISLLRQAMMLDPLTGAVLYPDEIWQMTDEMLVACEKLLPQYKDEIANAKKRLATSYVEPHKPVSEKTRKKVKTLDEIRTDTEGQKVYFRPAHNN